MTTSPTPATDTLLAGDPSPLLDQIATDVERRTRRLPPGPAFRILAAAETVLRDSAWRVRLAAAVPDIYGPGSHAWATSTALVGVLADATADDPTRSILTRRAHTAAAEVAGLVRAAMTGGDTDVAAAAVRVQLAHLDLLLDEEVSNDG